MIINIQSLAKLLAIQNTSNPDMLEQDQLWGVCDRSKFIKQAHEIVEWLNQHKDIGVGSYITN